MASQETMDFFTRAEAQLQWVRDASKAVTEHAQLSAQLPALRAEVEAARKEAEKARLDAGVAAQAAKDGALLAQADAERRVRDAAAARDAKLTELRREVELSDKAAAEAQAVHRDAINRLLEDREALEAEIAELTKQRDAIKAEAVKLRERLAGV